jgi:hypothetical protein
MKLILFISLVFDYFVFWPTIIGKNIAKILLSSNIVKVQTQTT